MYWQIIKQFNIKDDFRRIHWGLKNRTNGKLPTWAIVIYYVIMFPIGILMTPFVPLIVRIIMHVQTRKIQRMWKEELEVE